VAWSDVIITIEVGRLINGTDVETMDGGHRNSKESVSLIIESEVLFKFELSVTISRFGSNSLQSEPETTQIHIISR
jgi:phosphoribosylaminoimidazole carboxylase (NCAIR synthetase)